MPSLAERVLDLMWPGHPKTPRGVVERLVPIVLNLLRLTFACIVAYLLTVVVRDGPPDMTGTLTALLVMQASAQSSAKMALVRVAAVLCGVGIALGVAALVGLHWWSLAFVIFAALVVAKAFRLDDQALEVPISGMLILASAGQPIAAETRIVNTLIGAAVGMVMPLLLPPTIPARRASGAVRDVARRLHDIYAETAKQAAAGPVTRDTCTPGLEQLRDTVKLVTRANDKIKAVSDLRKWNTRAVGIANIAPLLQTALDTLDRCLLASRVLFLAVTEEAPEEQTLHDGFGTETRIAFAAVLRDIGLCLDAYGALIEAEAGGIESDTDRLFAERMASAQQTRLDLTQIMVDSPHDTEEWMFHGAMLAAIDHLLDYLDVEVRLRARHDWKSSQAGRAVPADVARVNRVNLLQFSRARRLIREGEVTNPDLQANFLGNEQPTEIIPVVRPRHPKTPPRHPKTPPRHPKTPPRHPDSPSDHDAH